MRKEQSQKVWTWAALAVLIGPMVFSACSLMGLDIGRRTADPGGNTPTLVFTLAIPAATATVEASPLPATPSPTAAPARIESPTSIPEEEPTGTPEPDEIQPVHYSVQLGSPRYIRAFTHADQGCQWIGVAGQVFDATGAGASDVAVRVTGGIDGQTLQRSESTGAESPFGPGGYEIFLMDHPGDAGQKVSVQLFTLDGQPLSDPYQIDAPRQCDQNLIVLNFLEGEGPQQLFIPVISR